MLNKNDPLISAVQEVMKQNQAHRDAIRAVNEKFGIQDRKALPHEKQGDWDNEYKKVISEGSNTLKEDYDPEAATWSKKFADNSRFAKSQSKADHLYARINPAYKKEKEKEANHYAKKSKDYANKAVTGMDEETDTVSEESATAASKKAEKGTKWKVKSRNWDRDGSEVELRQGKRVKMKGTYDRNASMFTMSKTKKGKFDPKSKEKDYDDAKDILKTVKESEQIDEVLDTPGKRLKYALKAGGSKLKAGLTGDKKTDEKRTSGLKMAGKKASAAVEKSKQDSVNNELARDALKKMAHKTGYGALYDKSGLYEEEQIDEISSKLAGSYLKGHHKSVNDPKGITIWKAFKRRDGKKLAVDKLSGTAKVPTKDE